MNTKLVYMYRDGYNYKKYNEIIVNGTLELDDLIPFLRDGEFFIPSEVGMPDLQNEHFEICDHIWHELVSVSPYSEAVYTTMSASELSFLSASKSDWNEYLVYRKKGLI